MIRLPMYVLFIVLLVAGGCGSSEPIIMEPDESINAVEGPRFDVFQVVGNELNVTNWGPNDALMPGLAAKVTLSSHAGNGRYIALGTTSESGSHLFVYDREEKTSEILFSGGTDLVYTGHWDDSDTFYFGQYQPEGKKMGAGSIHSYSAGTGDLTRVPCSASRAVLAVLPGNSLLVRNSDSLFKVAVEDCSTLKTIDARKMYHVSVSPTAQHMAYVLRDLVYNRDTRAYEPDSTLYLQPVSGGDPIKVIGDKYQPRHISWSPDGMELAFDVETQDGSGKRAVSIYSIASGSSSYLEAPTATPYSPEKPFYSPSGRHVLFEAISSDGLSDLMWKSTGDPFSHTVDTESETGSLPHYSWIDADLLLLQAASGARIIDVSGGNGVTIWQGPATAVYVLPAG